MGSFQGLVDVEKFREILSGSEDQTLSEGRDMGHSLKGGELILLKGPMGAGKSVFARGIARGLGVEGTVRSPSFNLMREYRGRLIFRHWDLYRLDGGYAELGILESVSDDAVVVVEWAERWGELDKYSTAIIILDYGERKTDRTINFSGNEMK